MNRLTSVFAFSLSLLSCNDAYNDGQNLAEELCKNYNSNSDSYQNNSAYVIKKPDQYIYFETSGYADFRRGFLEYLVLNCNENMERISQWRDIGRNPTPPDKLDY